MKWFAPGGAALRSCLALLTVLSVATAAPAAVDPALADADVLLRAFGCNPTDLPELPAVDMIVDDSKSMRGFVQSEGGDRFRAVVDQLLQGAVGDSITFRKLSAPRQEATTQATDLFVRDFYREEDTPLDRAFSFAKANPARITIILSDLEQSTDRNDVRVVQRALAASLVEKNAILLLGVRSAFSNQEAPRCAPACSPQQHRFFYVLIMAPSRGILRAFVEATRIDRFAFDDATAAADGPTLFYSSRPALEADSVELFTDPERGPWKPWRESVGVSCADQAGGRLQSSFTYAKKWPLDPLMLRVHVVVHDPIQNFSRAVARVSMTEYPGLGNPRFVRAGVSHSARVQVFALDRVVSFNYVFARPRPHTWNVYRVWFESAQGSTEIPRWVRTCSLQHPTTTNAYPTVAALVRTMIKVVTEKEPMIEHYIAIGQD